MKLSDFHESVVEHYKLKDVAKDGWLYIGVSKGMYGLPQAGILAHKLPEKKLNTRMVYRISNNMWCYKIAVFDQISEFN